MSLLTDLLNTLDTRSLSEMAVALGESNKSVSDGLRSVIATLLGGMASKSGNSNLLRQTLELAPPMTQGVSWSNAAGAIADPNSPELSTGRRILSTLFGDAEGLVTRALGAGTGLQTGKISSLMAMAAPMVMGFLGKRVRDDGMSMAGLGSMLEHETPAIRSALPRGLSDLFWPPERVAAAASPVAQTAAGARPSRAWWLPLLLIALIPALFWLARQGRRPIVETAPAPAGTANRVVPETPIETPKPSPLKTVDLYFNPGSMTLRAQSEAKLKDFVGALMADPSAHVVVNGYTDNVGSPAANLRLSQRHADAVKDGLVRMGIPADQISAQGFGEANPKADNATAQGRAANRRVSVAIGER